jgi:hypothetical protein
MRASQRVIVPHATYINQLTKRVAAEDGYGWRTELDGSETIIYEVLLDDRSLGRIVRRASINKAGCAKDGPLEVRILSRRKP